MMKTTLKKLTAGGLTVLLLTAYSGSAWAAPPTKPGGSGGSSASYTGAATISSSTTATGANYASVTAGENALLVSGGVSTLTDVTVTKSGDDSSGDSADFYGTNAAVLVYNGATLNLKGGAVTTNGTHANAVFAYGEGKVNLEGTTITTTGNTSGGIMVTGGGTLNATDLTVETSGNSSAAIRSDRGGGTMTVNGGTYTAHGTGSPAIYSTADITVNDAALNSTTSEGVVIEGKNSVTLNRVTLTDSNLKHNGKSDTYKTIFLYQSMSGDASVGTSHFTAKDSAITGKNGDLFFVTNTSAVIDLENNTLVNEGASGGFLRIQAGAWGTSGKNGGTVTLNMTDQQAEGDIFVDGISTLAMSLTGGSVYTGAVNTDGTARQLEMTLSADSVWVLTGDSILTGLTNADGTNGNIYLNGHTLTVNGKTVTGNSGSYAPAQEGAVTAFRDVAKTAYYYEAVLWAVQNGVTYGTSASTFSPDATCTRAQAVTFLWRAAGEPEVSGSHSFTDVKTGSYYEKAVIWAAQNGITSGTTATTFSPNDNCTRAQIVTFLWRAAGEPEVSGSHPFTDVKTSAYYEKPVVWAVAKGVTSGTTTTTFSPTDTCTRSQIVTFLYRHLAS